VTQLLKWKKQSHNGKNAYNNNVHINFETNDVKFEPIKWHKARTYLTFLAINIALPASIVKSIIPITFMVVGLYALAPANFLNLLIFINIVLKVLVVWIVCGILASLIYFYPPWRENHFPKYNATMLNIQSLGLRLQRLKITPDMLYYNTYIIPKFSNVRLDYELEGDFAKYIKTLDIIALKKLKKGKLVDDAFNFKAMFTFSQPIKDGIMKIKYI